jgi:hypothetical protein
LISRGIERVLTEKGYKLQPLEFPTEILENESVKPLKIQPAALTGTNFPDVDGLMLVHVTFHHGISVWERSSDEGPYSRIYIFATARLIDVKKSEEIWRDEGRARPFYSVSFFSRLNYAVFTLTNGLFETLPARN